MTERKIRSYTGPRKDVVRLLQKPPRRVLDLGCSDGSLGVAIKAVYPSVEVHGVEFDSGFVDVARSRLNSVLQADLNDADLAQFPCEVDLLICADILEHTVNPEKVLKSIVEHCTTAEAQVILSLPNVQHITVILNLLKGVWPQNDRGIFDRTHLRWFTLRSIYDLADAAGLKVQIVDRNFRLLDQPGGKLNRLAKRYLRSLPFKNFSTYQYIVLLERR